MFWSSLHAVGLWPCSLHERPCMQLSRHVKRYRRVRHAGISLRRAVIFIDKATLYFVSTKQHCTLYRQSNTVLCIDKATQYFVSTKQQCTLYRQSNTVLCIDKQHSTLYRQSNSVLCIDKATVYFGRFGLAVIKQAQ